MKTRMTRRQAVALFGVVAPTSAIALAACGGAGGAGQAGGANG